MRAPLGSERRWRNVRLQTDTSAKEIEGIDIAEKKPAFLSYPILNIFGVAPQLAPPLNNLAKGYVKSITAKAQMRASSALQYRTIIVSGQTDGLTPSFNNPPTGDLMPRARVMMEQPAANAPLTASNAVNLVVWTSPLTPFHHPGVQGYIWLGGTAVGGLKRTKRRGPNRLGHTACG